jgi:hypothetical protein
MSKLISHRGNINGPDPGRENTTCYIQEALDSGYDVEIDVWIDGTSIYLGHDFPENKITLEWLLKRSESLWVHCKNIPALIYLKDYPTLNVFWHQSDLVTITTMGFVWAYPGNQPIKNSIAVLPEVYEDPVEGCYGICSDYISLYR